jgi:hypothetical protein
MSDSTSKTAAASVIHLADRAAEVIEITELEPRPYYGLPVFIGKTVNTDGSITQYPIVTWWFQRVARVPATVPHLFAYLSEARTRNISLIRGAPGNIERQPTRRQKAYFVVRGKDRGDHGFIDTPTSLFFLDVDSIKMQWRADPQQAVKNILAALGEPWASTSCVWFFSATHGLEMKDKRWTGKISDGKMRVRLAFITERALIEAEAAALTSTAKARIPQIDPCVSRIVQPNYIRRPHWAGHPGADVLGNIPTIGRIKGTREFLTLPDDLTHAARWAQAQGYNVDIADHPDAEAAVRGVGSDNSIRSHLMSAVMHLLNANPVPEVTSFADHSIDIVAKLREMVETHRSEICANLERHKRPWRDVLGYFPTNMEDWAHWLLDHPAALWRKTITLIKENEPEADDAATREAIYARVERTIEHAHTSAGDPFMLDSKPAELVVAPTGSRKSTLMRAHAVRFVTEHPDQSVVILMPRHRLGNEQIELLRCEHSNADAAVWRGRHADDPDAPDPQYPGKLLKMCRRPDEAKELELALLNVEHSLCKQGRGKKTIKCAFYDVCGYQRQKQTEANIWFAAHECMTQQMPKAFGRVGWVMIDESPLDAFMFGTDIDDQVTLELDVLRVLPPPPELNDFDADRLLRARMALYCVLDKLKVPIERSKGVPVSFANLSGPFIDKELDDNQLQASEYDVGELYGLEWRGKVVPAIRPDMTERQVREEAAKAAGNRIIKKLVTLWKLIEDLNSEVYGRIQLQRDKEGRIIRMVGLHPIAKGWNVRTLICDATGDAELLRAIWPQLNEEEPQGWQQLPRPKSVRVMQIVNRSISKWAIAIEGNREALERKIEGARRVYAALLTKALEYGGRDVAAITYKSTETWIKENCFVPDWLKLTHFGDVTGTNEFENVAALFVIGRPLASPEDVTRQAEALFGAYLAERHYRERRKGGRITIVPDSAGHTGIKVDVWQHRNPMAERLRRQVTEAAIIQAAGRARAGLRNDESPLDLHLWADIPLPELGPVEPVLWSEVDAGLDGLMLATSGMWLESIPDAAQAFAGLLKIDGLKSDRKKRGKGVPLIGIPISRTPLPRPLRYQRAGKGCRPQRALPLLGPAAARAWLEEKLGPLVRFEVITDETTGKVV